MTAPPLLTALISRYRSGDGFSRAEICTQYLDPVLGLLGWEPGMPGGEKGGTWVSRDVCYRTRGRRESVDYVLCSGDAGILAIQAGDPSGDEAGALDLRRFAWNAGLDLAILTNFGETAVYDTTIPVRSSDDARSALIAKIAVGRYEEVWEQVAKLLSRDRLKGGSLPLLSHREGLTGTPERVEQALLADLTAWRIALAKKIALQNPGLSSGILNEVIQYLITRILLLRILEDRGVAEYGMLMRVTEGGSVSGRLCGLFRYAEGAYGGGLFRFEDPPGEGEFPDPLILALSIDDEPLREIITGISPPASPYEFSVLPARVLSEVFSLFLGSRVRLPSGHRALVESCTDPGEGPPRSPPPRALVAYAVEKTLSGLLVRDSPGEPPCPRILDPSCGSGLFLISAFRYLLQRSPAWSGDPATPPLHRETNAKTGGDSPGVEGAGPGHPGPGDPASSGREGPDRGAAPGLPWDARGRILLDAIFGVDIDPRAVSTTRLLLLVELMEGQEEIRLPLPDLSEHIRCGNSLVGPDLSLDPDSALIDPWSREKLRIFDWGQAFPHVMASGGFDAVIGRPPLLREESDRAGRLYLERHYRCFPGTADLYHCFVEKGLSLLRQGGLLSLLLPGEWLYLDSGRRLRVFLEGYAIREVLSPGALIRRGKGVRPGPCLITVENAPPGSPVPLIQGGIPGTGTPGLHRHQVPLVRLSGGNWVLSDTRVNALVTKIRAAGTPLGEFVMGEIYQGVPIGSQGLPAVDVGTGRGIIAEDPSSRQVLKPFLSCQGLERFLPPAPAGYLIVLPQGAAASEYPVVTRHLSRVGRDSPSATLQHRAGRPGLRPVQGPAVHPDQAVPRDVRARPKIVFAGIARSPSFTKDESGLICPADCRVIGSSSSYLLGILNSRLFWFMILETIPPIHGGCRRLYGNPFENLPIFVPDFDNPAEKGLHDALEGMVCRMIGLRTAASRSLDRGESLVCRQRIADLDHLIDTTVYQLYGLNDDEIGIVERVTAGP